MTAAKEAGATRFRPVLMTALAMIIGMAPMALSAEQNAPLGRAVIGGLLFATVATLFFVPVVFSIAHRNAERTSNLHRTRNSRPIRMLETEGRQMPRDTAAEPPRERASRRANGTGCWASC